jgi:8-oxo-dGTP diphosphatase
VDSDAHVVVAGLLARDSHVLLCHRRSSLKWYPDVWDLPGGHVEANETPTAALVRELREELAIEIAEPRGECLLQLQGDGLDMSVWRITAWVGVPSNAAPEEHDDIGWFSDSDVRTLNLAHPDYPSLIAGALADDASRDVNT